MTGTAWESMSTFGPAVHLHVQPARSHAEPGAVQAKIHTDAGEQPNGTPESQGHRELYSQPRTARCAVTE